MPSALFLPPVLPREVMLWALKPKRVPRGSCLCLVSAGWSLCYFSKHFFRAWFGPRFPAQAAAPTSSGCQWKRELVTNRTVWQQTLSSCPSRVPSLLLVVPPCQGQSLCEGVGRQGGMCSLHRALCLFLTGIPHGRAAASCPQVNDALGQSWACPGWARRGPQEFKALRDGAHHQALLLVVTGALCFNASWNALLPLVKRIFVMHFIVLGMAIC